MNKRIRKKRRKKQERIRAAQLLRYTLWKTDLNGLLVGDVTQSTSFEDIQAQLPCLDCETIGPKSGGDANRCPMCDGLRQDRVWEEDRQLFEDVIDAEQENQKKVGQKRRQKEGSLEDCQAVSEVHPTLGPREILERMARRQNLVSLRNYLR